MQMWNEIYDEEKRSQCDWGKTKLKENERTMPV